VGSMLPQLTVKLNETLKLDPERPEYHRATVGNRATGKQCHVISFYFISCDCREEDMPFSVTEYVDGTKLSVTVLAALDVTGCVVARSTGNQQSSRLLSMSTANALICLPQVCSW
jgi:MoeA C-terminal region (domain IV)